MIRDYFAHVRFRPEGRKISHGQLIPPEDSLTVVIRT